MQHLFSVGIFPLLLASNQKAKQDINTPIESQQPVQGQIAISLTTHCNGTAYRLSLPSITLIGEYESIELNLIGEEDLQMKLREGIWQVVIGSGWAVYKVTEGKSSLANASLLNEAPQQLLIATEKRTSALLRFRIGQEILHFS